MKKYNLSKIMKRAWELVKKSSFTISEALKKAWEEAKALKEKFSGYVKMLKKSYEGMECEDVKCAYFYFKKWEKYGYSRIYINDYKNRRLGYIECRTKEICDVDNREVRMEAKRFIERYEF